MARKTLFIQNTCCCSCAVCYIYVSFMRITELLYSECIYHSNAVTLNISLLKDDTLSQFLIDA